MMLIAPLQMRYLLRLIAGLSSFVSTLILAAPAPSTYELFDLDGNTGFVLKGDAINDLSGISLAGNFDINNDGVADVAIGAYGADPNGSNRAGKVYVLFGGVGAGAIGSQELSNINSSDGFEISGVDAESFAGWSVSAAGDVNNDGIDDLIIGAPDSDVGGNVAAGKAFVVFGSGSIGSGGALNLASLSGGNGFVLDGFEITDRAGRAVAGGGDLNDDGIDDIVIGARGAKPNGRNHAGATYVVFGDENIGNSGVIELSLLDGNGGVRIIGAVADDRSGESVSFAGDINDDGVDDLILGAPGVDVNGVVDTGAAYIVFGDSAVGDSGDIDLGTLSGGNGFVVEGASILDGAGVSVSAAGDVNGDSIDDILIGADRADPMGNSLAGESYVVFGQNGIGSGGGLNLSGLNGSNGYVIEGESAADGSGVGVAGVGDVNGDGINDIAVGAHGTTSNGLENIGTTYVLLGGSSVGSSGTVQLTSLDGENGFALHGIAPTDLSSNAVAGIDDLNADGIGDIIIGASTADPDGKVRAGESYLVYMPLPDTAEPNNTESNPTTVDIEEIQSHNLAPVGDVDYFSFTLNQPGTIRIATANDGTAIDYDTVITLSDSQNNIIESNDNYNGSLYAQLIVALPAGNYHFRVSPAQTTQVIPSYSIELSLEQSSGQTCNGQLVTVFLGNGDLPSAGNDVILGTESDDLIFAGAGDDTICSLAGNDIITSGGGQDWIDAGDGDDDVEAGGKQDIVYGGDGNDYIDGGADDDTLFGEAGNDILKGRIGNDTLDGGDGIDSLSGGGGSDTLYAGSGATVGTGVFVSGGNGDDLITGGPDADDLRGSGGEDEIHGEGGNDRITGGAGRDTIYGGVGNDYIRGQISADNLFGEAGDDIVTGGPGDDDIDGGTGADECAGQAGQGDTATNCEMVIGVP